MYLRITSRCNMACGHCCYSCAPGKGAHMDFEHFKMAVDAIADFSECIALGGGEPTIHPDFFRMLDYVMEHRCPYRGGHSFYCVCVITNGKATGRARKLIRRYETQGERWGYDSEHDRLSIELSRDQYHDPIHPDIVEWYSRPRRAPGAWYARNFIRNTTAELPPKMNGRGADLPDAVDECIGCGLECDPDGKIYACTHRDCEPLADWFDFGSAWDIVQQLREITDDEIMDGTCIHDIPKDILNQARHQAACPC